MLHYDCPDCGVKLESQFEVAGKKVRCLGCQAVFIATFSRWKTRSRFPVVAVFVVMLLVVSSVTVGLVYSADRWLGGSKKEEAKQVVQVEKPKLKIPVPPDPPKPLPPPELPARPMEEEGGNEPNLGKEKEDPKLELPPSKVEPLPPKGKSSVENLPKEIAPTEPVPNLTQAIPLTDVGKIKRMVFSRSHPTFIGLIEERQEKEDTRVTVVSGATGKTVGRTAFPKDYCRAIAISDDGKWVACVLGEALGAEVEIRATQSPDSKPIRFKPKPSTKRQWETSPGWVAFLGNSRLLTFDLDQGFDVWSIPDLKRLSSRSTEPDGFLSFDFFNQIPQNFALSPDRKTFYLLEKGEFIAFNLADGKEARRFDALPKDSKINGVAISQDGNRLICAFKPKGTVKGGLHAGVWDCTTGKLISDSKVPTDYYDSDPITWWGQSHAMVGGQVGGLLIETATGKLIGSLRVSGESLIGSGRSGDDLWGIYRENDGKPKLFFLRAPSIPMGSGNLHYTIDATGLVKFKLK